MRVTVKVTVNAYVRPCVLKSFDLRNDSGDWILVSPFCR